MKQVTMDNIKSRIAVIEGLNARGVGAALRNQQFELACLQQLVAVTEQRDSSLSAERVWEASMMEACGEDGPASVSAEIKSLRELRDTALESLREQVKQLAAENTALKDWSADTAKAADDMATADGGGGGYVESLSDIETAATDASLSRLRNEALRSVEYPKNSSQSNGWTIDPEFLSRVQERARAVYGYKPGLEETEAALLVGLDYLREGKAGEVCGD